LNEPHSLHQPPIKQEDDDTHKIAGKDDADDNKSNVLSQQEKEADVATTLMVNDTDTDPHRAGVGRDDKDDKAIVSVSETKKPTMETEQDPERNVVHDGVVVDAKKELEPLPALIVEVPPPTPPSGLTLAFTRLVDVQSQMEFAHAKLLLLEREQQWMQTKIKVLQPLPVGMDAYRTKLERLIQEQPLILHDDDENDDGDTNNVSQRKRKRRSTGTKA
jgi:hypothetical protein